MVANYGDKLLARAKAVVDRNMDEEDEAGMHMRNDRVLEEVLRIRNRWVLCQHPQQEKVWAA